MFTELVENIALLITLCWMHRMIMRHLDGHNKLSKICEGLLFGVVCIIGMENPLVLIEGVIIDGRAAVLSMAAFFGGPLVGTIAGIMTGSYRLWLGGVGAVPGLLSILMPVLMGLAFSHMHRRGWIPLNMGSLVIFSLMLEGTEVLSLALLPAEYFSLFFDLALVPLMIVLMPATLLLGLMLKDDQLQKINREALRQSEAHLRAISEAVPDLSIVLDEDGRYLKINVPDNDMLFAGVTELLGKRLQDVLPANQADIFLKFISRTLASESPQTIEYEMKSEKGIRNFEARARRLDTLIKGRRAVVLMARDITERVAYDKDRRIAAIAFESQEGMIITDAQTRIIKVNGAFSRITGYTEADVIDQPTRMFNISQQDSEYYKELWQTLIEEGFWQGEILNRRKSGDIFSEWLTISAVHDDKGRVINYVASFTDITERKSAEQKIQNLAFYDPLTSLPNRRLLRERLQQAMILCERNHMYGALILLDLDDFKNVNDLYGHQLGDELLCHVAKRLTKTLREQDTVARLGGDEFVILLEGFEQEVVMASSKIEEIGRKLLHALRQPYLVNGWHFNNSTSLGIVMFNDSNHTIDELMQHADLSMYNSKASGKNSLSFYNPQMQEVVSLRLKLEEDIRRGLAAGEFVIYLQSQVGLHRQLEGAEALVRWEHPQRGLLGPDIFIEIAERSDLIELMDLATLRQGCELLACWADQPQRAGLNLAVNISSKLLYRDDFIDVIKHLLDYTKANPQHLKLEITESLLLTDKNKAVIRMQTLRELGIRFSIDDFGTGYSSMAYLQQLPLDQLKIDQSFVRNLPENTSSLAIVRAILAMAHSLDIEVIAEGVETQAQYDILDDSGCKHFQGYLFGKPVAVKVFESTIVN